MTARTVTIAAIAVLASIALATPAFAQDSFGGAPADPMSPHSPSPASAIAPTGASRSTTDAGAMPAGYGSAAPPVANAPSAANPSASIEMQDYGVPAQDALRPSETLHAPTPTSVPGARTIDTKTLASLLRDPQRHVLLFHVLGSTEHLPGAVAAAPAGQGGGFDDAAQREFGQFLQGMSRGDTSAPMVFYCGGTHCWMSYNAALRAVHLGYRNVAWYRGGIEAWRSAGLPIEDAGSASTVSRGAPPAAPNSSFDDGAARTQSQ